MLSYNIVLYVRNVSTDLPSTNRSDPYRATFPRIHKSTKFTSSKQKPTTGNEYLNIQKKMKYNRVTNSKIDLFLKQNY